MSKRKESVTRYFRWDGDACRLYEHPDGRRTADLYRFGMGIVPIDAFQLDYAVEISQTAYLALVEEEFQLNKDDEATAAIDPPA